MKMAMKLSGFEKLRRAEKEGSTTKKERRGERRARAPT